MSGALQAVFMNQRSFKSNWIGLLAFDSNSFGNSVAVDLSGNVFIYGYARISGNNEFLLAKYDNAGVIQWQKSLGAVTAEIGYSVAIDSSGNAYTTGSSNILGTNSIQLAKYDTSGTLQFQRSIGGAGADDGYSIAVDSSGVYIAGGNGSNNFQLVKYDTSGALQWQRQLGGGGGTEEARGIALDSSSNVYVCGVSDTVGSNNFQIAKYNSSGTIQWQRRLGSANNDRGYAIAVDSSSNVYVGGFSDDGGSLDCQLAKYNSSGTIQWQRELGSASSSTFGFGLATDSSNNLYVCGMNDASGSYGVQLAKYNTSGTIQWQRILRQSGSNLQGTAIAIKDSNLYINGYGVPTTASNCFLFAKLPTDGSLTGTYSVGGVSLIYAASSLTDASTSLTEAASTLTDSATTLVDAVTTLTDATSTLTSSVTSI
jgi:hypothetical protein